MVHVPCSNRSRQSHTPLKEELSRSLHTCPPRNVQNNLLDTESSQPDSARHRSKFCTPWTNGSDPTKRYSDPDLMGYLVLSALPTDLDFNPSTSVAPTAPHYHPMKFGFSYDGLPSELLSTFSSSSPFLEATFPDLRRIHPRRSASQHNIL